MAFSSGSRREKLLRLGKVSEKFYSRETKNSRIVLISCVLGMVFYFFSRLALYLRTVFLYLSVLEGPHDYI